MTLVQIIHLRKNLILILDLVIRSVQKIFPSAALKKWTAGSHAEDGRMVGFIKVFCAPVSMNAMALIGTSYLEGRMWTFMLGNGGIGSSEPISCWKFWYFFCLHDRKMFFTIRRVWFTAAAGVCVFKSESSEDILLILFIILGFNVFILFQIEGMNQLRGFFLFIWTIFWKMPFFFRRWNIFYCLFLCRVSF